MRIGHLTDLLVAAGLACWLALPVRAEEAGGQIVLHYDFSAGQGTALRDVGTNRCHGVIRGAEWVKTDYGSALRFRGKGTTCGVYGPANPALNMGCDDWTITMLVKIPEKSGPFWLIWNGASDGYNGYRLAVWDNFKLYVLLGADRPLRYYEAAGAGSAGLGLNDNGWHMIATVFQRQGVMQLYVDGVPSGEGAAIAELAGKPIVTKSPLGVFYGLSDDAECLIADVVVYRRSYTDDEIKDLFAMVVCSKQR